LAQVLPVLAVFATSEVADNLAYVFESVSLQSVVVTDIGERLTEFALLCKAPPDA
jgi:hypothetical protein